MDTHETSKTLTADQLEFREITRPLPAGLGALLSQKERVHPADAEAIEENRLAPQASGAGIWDKHCYGLFVPGSEEPEAAVYVKFMKRKLNDNGRVMNEKLTGNIQMILNEAGKPIESPNTAIFYTITNMGKNKIERSAEGHTVGEELINRVAVHVGAAYAIDTLSTLSPLRIGTGEKAVGAAQWIEGMFASGQPLLTANEQQRLFAIASALPGEPTDKPYEAITRLHQQFDQLRPEDAGFFSQLMCDLGVHYLAEAKTPPKKEGAVPTALDSVEHFHLSNGAQLANIHYHPPGQTTHSDSVGALGLMANYRYEPDMLLIRKHIYQHGHIDMDHALEMRHAARMELLETPGISGVDVSQRQSLGPNSAGNSIGHK